MRSLSSALAGAFVLAVAGCAQLSLAPPLTAPAKGGAAWSEVTSRHFVVHTDLDARSAQGLAEQLERIDAAFEDLLAKPADELERIDVVAFARRVDYLEIAKQRGLPNSSAFFTPRTHDLEPSPTVVLSGDFDQAKRTTLQHELTHRFVRLQLLDPPTWLNEGLAEYNSTLALHDGRAWFGAMPPKDEMLFRPGGRIPVGRDATLRWLTIDQLPTVKSLLEATPDTFYERIEDDPNPQHPLSYQGAWLLVHMLKSLQLPYHARFDQLMALLSAGVHRDAAFAQAFAGVSIDELERQYRRHAVELSAPSSNGDHWTLFASTVYTPREAGPVHAAVPMSEAQVHLTFLQLRAWQPPYHDAANADLMAAQIEAPHDREVLYWRALFALRGGAPEQAEGLLRAALADLPSDGLEVSPREPRYRFALIVARLAQLQKGGHKPSPADLEPLNDDFHQLERVASSATELDQVARVQMDHPELGIPFAMRAVQADPTCFYCFDTLAQLHAARGKFAQAAQAEERALSLVPEYERMPGGKARLDEFRRSAVSPPPSTPPPSSAPTTTRPQS